MMQCHRCQGEGTVTGADRDCPVCKGEGQIPEPIVGPHGTPVGHINSVTETPAGIVASGGWCAPSETIYDMASKDTTYTEPEPDSLPVDFTWKETHIWVVINEYGDAEEFETKDEAIVAFGQEAARTATYDSLRMEERIIKTRLVTAQHGRRVAVKPTAEEIERITRLGFWGAFPTMPTAPRGGIQFRQPNPSNEKRETP